MPGAPFTQSALGIDLSARIVGSTTVVASPAAGAETIIASVAVPGGLSYATGVIVVAFAAFTVGTDGVSANLRIRQTNVAGTVKAATGATNTGALAAAQLTELVAWGLDLAPADGQLYKATLEVGSGSAPSTVSAVFLGVIAVQMETPWLGRAGFGEDAGRLPLNNPSKALENSRVVKTGDGWLYGFTVTNTNAAAQFVQVFDAHSLPADGAVPLIGKSVPAGDAVGFSWLPPRRFEAGLILCNSTTQGTKTIGAADCLFDAQFVQGRRAVPIISGGGGGGFTKPSQWTIGSDGGLTVVISDADGQISLQRGGATGAEVQYGVANDGGGVEEAILRVSGKGGGATSVVVANGSVAGTTSALDGRGHVELFTETGVKAFEAWDDQGNVLRFALLVAGQPMIGVVAAPADAALAASQVALWFDDTNGVGNTKLMVKGKSADGTVKTATVLLA